MEIEWLLPTHESRVFNEELISKNAKYHCFISQEDNENGIQNTGESLCKRHKQILGYYEKMESGDILQFPAIACPICFKKWKKNFNID